MNIITKVFGATALLATASIAFAADSSQVPEPSVLGLLAAGGIVGAIIAIRKRRK